MSRIGKMPITIPAGVSIELQDNAILVTGPKGELRQQVEPEVWFTMEDNVLRTFVKTQTKRSAALWGLYRSLAANMIHGVAEGFTKELEMAGVGHRATMQGSNLQLSVGFSHPVIMTPPQGIAFAVAENTKITVSGISKEHVGQTAATIRAVKPPEPYKGKGIHYKGEKIRRKAGKAAKAVGGK
jgi:large subunit ribosomal protein L6